MIGTIKYLIKKQVARFGYQIVRKPLPLISNPAAEIDLDFNYIIAHHLLKTKDFFFLQIGANDGILCDPIYEFIKKYHWKGVLVEPQKVAFRKLKENYAGFPDILFKNVAISDSVGIRDIYKINCMAGNLPDWAPGVASFDRNVLLNLRHYIPNIENIIEVEKVECITFENLIASINFSKLDLLQIDTEGYDYKIIKMIDFHVVKPVIIQFEHALLNERDRINCLELLISKGYRIKVEEYNSIAYLG